LILGGARSGKSSMAERMAREMGGRVTFVATAEAHDAEMRRRIEVHRLNRPTGWRTIEEPLDLARAIVAACSGSDVVIVDCLTLWVSNHLCRLADQGSRQTAEGPDVCWEAWGRAETPPVDDARSGAPACPGRTREAGSPISIDPRWPLAVERLESELAGQLGRVVEAARSEDATLLVVSNEVGLGLVPEGALGRAYRDLLGAVNRRLAAEADRVILMVAGLPLDVKRLAAEQE